MTNQDKRARKWAEYILGNGAYVDDDALAAAEFVMTNTKPETMADVEWNDDEHRGMGAVDKAGQEWVMLSDDGSYINLVGLDLNPVGAKSEDLTPNGKRYELIEVGATVSQHENAGDDQPGWPKALETVRCYESAPVGTVVCRSISPRIVYCKTGYGIWEETGRERRFASYEMGGVVRVVLRWGDES